jgi:WD40 repeat protein
LSPTNDTVEAVLEAPMGQPPLTQAAQARSELLIQDKEEAAIIFNVNTMSPQTAYSTPRLTWRPDGSGIYISSDDGRIRGFEASTGKLILNLDAHEPMSKIRCLCAGYSGGRADQTSTEILLSGGFDQKMIVWSTS